MWYRTGTVTVTNGSAVVTGAGTDFVGFASVGDMFVGPDLRVYEVTQVVSATDLRITPVYQAGTAGGQGYAIAPTQSFARDLALSAAALLNTFAAVRDGVGQGLFADGGNAVPGIRFAADQDTGLFRYGPNLMSAATGGTERMRFGDTNSSIAPLYANDGMTVQRGGTPGSIVTPMDIFGNLGGAATMRLRFGSAANGYASHSFIEAQTLTGAASDLRFGTSGTLQMGIGDDGTVRPGRDNQQSFGTGALRWSVVYAGTGSINTSDKREKTDIGDIPAEWLDAWGDVQWQRFRFRDAVEAKQDEARWHLGLIAQQVQEAFAARGLDARDIGLLCHDEWKATPAVKEVRDEDGEIVTPAQPARKAGDRWGLRYDECQAIEAAWQRRRINELEAAVAALTAAQKS